ncbi:putative shikimate kinase [Candidatus Tremblaya phenacola PAVE]|nr:putative shikimate kinase [Candidatus Tremblaya phenacola PAVE]
MRSHLRTFVLGPMGIGKSSISRTLATAVRTESWGTDEKLGQLIGIDVSTTFSFLGQKQFRKWEAELLGGFLMPTTTNAGGGTMLSSQNRMRSFRSLSFGLEANITSIKTRLRVSNSRPEVQVGKFWKKRLRCCKVCSKCHLRQTKMKLPDSLNFLMGLLTNILTE